MSKRTKKNGVEKWSTNPKSIFLQFCKCKLRFDFFIRCIRVVFFICLMVSTGWENTWQIGVRVSIFSIEFPSSKRIPSSPCSSLFHLSQSFHMTIVANQKSGELNC
ncbi:hypothetical protein ABFS83_07G101300 [Erythranthe nasuta]